MFHFLTDPTERAHALCVGTTSVGFLGISFDNFTRLFCAFVSLVGTVASVWMFQAARRERHAQAPDKSRFPFRPDVRDHRD
jgi:hypothetical protein